MEGEKVFVMFQDVFSVVIRGQEGISIFEVFVNFVENPVMQSFLHHGQVGDIFMNPNCGVYLSDINVVGIHLSFILSGLLHPARFR